MCKKMSAIKVNDTRNNNGENAPPPLQIKEP